MDKPNILPKKEPMAKAMKLFLVMTKPRMKKTAPTNQPRMTGAMNGSFLLMESTLPKEGVVVEDGDDFALVREDAVLREPDVKFMRAQVTIERVEQSAGDH